jgi:hypothetical protein
MPSGLAFLGWQIREMKELIKEYQAMANAAETENDANSFLSKDTTDSFLEVLNDVEITPENEHELIGVAFDDIDIYTIQYIAGSVYTQEHISSFSGKKNRKKV